ncbi:hypothetical protein N0V88_004165 [Collariella sp. IMI 366227]|nr:hypothetical protein N0V88_004165 [Collariella sp. IMI 366227]
MAFSFGNVNNAMMGASAGGAGGVAQGSDLEVIQTEGLGFLSIAGEAKVQLTSSWSPPPAPTASLLSIASRKGLVAAAGPDAIYIATTESVRKAFEGAKNGDSDIRSFTPQAKLPLPIRISQLAFTADEQYLIASAESGGGLAVYDVQTLLQGGAQSAFEISTNGEALSALIPNPMPESAAFCAIVTTKGNLLMADLAGRKLVSGPNGPVLRSQVTCAAWSTKGKQIVAGMADGTIYQMTPDGVEKGHIPKPPKLGDYHVSSVTWLENHVFLTVHTSTNGQGAVFHIITRQQPPGGTPSFTFQGLTDPVEPFVTEKVAHHSVLRLKDFPPNLQDLLLVSSTANESVGLLTRSKTPLASDKPAESITNVFTTTELADDSKRAQLPMGEEMTETYPVGSALDLSSKDKVYKPIPTDEIELSPGPLPGLWMLNNEGVLASWWVVYNESIRSGTTYPGIATEGAAAPAFGTPAPAPAAALPSAFGSPAVKAPTFGSPSTAAPAFGGSSMLGAKPSPWATAAGASTTPAFGSTAFGSKPAAASPAFGSSTFGSPAAAPAFGQSSSVGLGAKVSPWAAASTSGAGSAFGQSGFSSAGSTAGKVFGSGAAAPATGGFANFASKGGFGALGGAHSGSSIFGSKPGGALTSSAPEVSMDSDTAFPPPSAKVEKPALGNSPFVLGTTFKAEPLAAQDNEKPRQGAGTSMFGSGFGLSLDDAAKKPAPAVSKEEDMSTTPPPEEKPKSIFSPVSTTPTTTPAPQKFDFKSTATPGANLFGSKPATAEGFSNIFGTPKPASTELPKPKPVSSIFETPKVKKEEEDKVDLSKIPAAPLPPDTTSKAVYHLSSSSSGSECSPTTASTPPIEAEEAHLPPDFLGKTAKKVEPVPEAAPLPPDTASSSKPKPEGRKSKSVTPTTPDEAPLPPNFLDKPAAKAAPTLPAMPDSEGEEELSEGEVSEEEREGEEDEEGDDESEVGSEGSGIDVTKELSPTAGYGGGQTPGVTPQSSFGGVGGSTFSTISRTEAEQSRPLFGEITRNAPPLFPKSVNVPQSPRSPSPVRGTARSSILRPNEPARSSFSAPGTAATLLSRKAAPQQSAFGYSTGQKASVDPNVQAQRKLAERMRAEEHVLVDPEDEGIQQILHSKLEPTLAMHEFLAVDSKLEALQRSGQEVPMACEALWRDINRMIDRLGLNSRSLQSFLLGHSTEFKQEGRSKPDLEHPEDWVLVEARELGSLIADDLAPSLESSRIADLPATHRAIQSLTKDLAKLRAKEEDMRKILASHTDSTQQRSITKSLPLSAEQATQQNELRRAYAGFSKRLAETEEALTLLRARVASAGGASRGPVPTVDAILRTIAKMTSMAEKRSGDIDVLESQMRKLRLGSVGPNGGTPGPRSREGSPFKSSVLATPTRRSMLMSPERGMRESSFASSVGSYRSVTGGATPSPRKKMSMFSVEEKRELRERMKRRKGTLGILERVGLNVERLRDDE